MEIGITADIGVAAHYIEQNISHNFIKNFKFF